MHINKPILIRGVIALVVIAAAATVGILVTFQISTARSRTTSTSARYRLPPPPPRLDASDVEQLAELSDRTPPHTTGCAPSWSASKTVGPAREVRLPHEARGPEDDLPGRRGDPSSPTSRPPARCIRRPSSPTSRSSRASSRPTPGSRVPCRPLGELDQRQLVRVEPQRRADSPAWGTDVDVGKALDASTQTAGWA